MKKIVILFMLCVSLFAFDKSKAKLVDVETMDLNGGVVATYYCYENKLYVVLTDGEKEQALPVVWYKNGVLDTQVSCEDYNEWQIASMVESDE